jgi:hypothetical protein
MSRGVYSSLEDAFQPLNPQEQKVFHQSRVQQEEQTRKMWEDPCQKDNSEIRGRMNQGYELPPYCAKEGQQFKEFQRQSNEKREAYLKNIEKRPRPQLSNDYQDIELGMYQLEDRTKNAQSLVKVPNAQRAHLQKRLEELERELQKYQFLLRVFDEERTPKLMDKDGDEENIESFHNYNDAYGKDGKDDIIDLIVLLAIGLLIIFVLDSVFKMGKISTSRKS